MSSHLTRDNTYKLHIRDSAVCTATGYGQDGREIGVQVPVRARFFSFLRRPDQFWGHLASYLMGTESSFPGLELPRSDADHSPPTSAGVIYIWIYISTPPYVFTA
jgi:hypothetical protein